MPCGVYWGAIGLRGIGAGQCLFVMHECCVVDSWMSTYVEGFVHELYDEC